MCQATVVPSQRLEIGQFGASLGTAGIQPAVRLGILYPELNLLSLCPPTLQTATQSAHEQTTLQTQSTVKGSYWKYGTSLRSALNLKKKDSM